MSEFEPINFIEGCQTPEEEPLYWKFIRGEQVSRKKLREQGALYGLAIENERKGGVKMSQAETTAALDHGSLNPKTLKKLEAGEEIFLGFVSRRKALILGIDSDVPFFGLEGRIIGDDGNPKRTLTPLRSVEDVKRLGEPLSQIIVRRIIAVKAWGKI